MGKKIKIIIPYFGKFPSTIKPFLHSCKFNPDFEWLIFTDDTTISDIPQNVKMISCTLADIKTRFEDVCGFPVALDRPYKICDFRPAFGLAFSDYLTDCDFWGWGDIDLVYGDLHRFITDGILEQYDKIFPCGHLSLIRNDEQVNHAFMKEIKGTLDYRDVFADSKSFIFDEYKGLNEKLLALGKRVYGAIDFADMDVVFERFRTADKYTISMVFPAFPFKKGIPRNYKNQVFFWEDGKAFRAYINPKGSISFEELAYIHYRHKIPCEIEPEKGFYVSNKGFIDKTEDIKLPDFQHYNPYPGSKTELVEFARFTKERAAMKMGSNKKACNFIRIIKGKEPLK